MSCITTTTTNNNNPGCINPISWLLSKFTEVLGKGQGKSTPADQLDRYLDKGLVTPLCGFCCPCPESAYVLASVETFLKFAEAVPYQEFVGTCCNQFSPTLEDMEECLYTGSEDIDRILDKGIVEAGLINGQSQLPLIYQWIQSVLPLGNSSGTEIFDRIIDKGIVIWCEEQENGEGNLVLGSVETFLKYAEALGVTDGQYETCCINVHASIETYLKYAEAVGSGGGTPVPA